jgi:hypothetical protein
MSFAIGGTAWHNGNALAPGTRLPRHAVSVAKDERKDNRFLPSPRGFRTI